ncbi:cob(I)yrinic acid a,c-diamide adenosyltransferase [Patescibacteria group bacterium]|nr:MAG: cob(I)yrinic acid a,c-diamide adenosyltransferase [Patescibacteria group bacterium]
MKNRPPEHWGLLQVYTGNGKGKTTAALGVALRAAAIGKKVAIIFFDKGGEHYSERIFLDWLGRQKIKGGGRIRYLASGADRIDQKTGRFRFGVTPKDRLEAQKGLRFAASALGGRYDLVILDEFNSSLKLGMISERAGKKLLDNRAGDVECICTGRGAPGWLRRRADLITEMKLVKHYFYRGYAAREGIDF